MPLCYKLVDLFVTCDIVRDKAKHGKKWGGECLSSEYFHSFLIHFFVAFIDFEVDLFVKTVI